MIGIKPILKTTDELLKIKGKFAKVRSTTTLYHTKAGTLCTLQNYWQGNEKVAQWQDWGYGATFKDYLHDKIYTNYKPWAEK